MFKNLFRIVMDSITMTQNQGTKIPDIEKFKKSIENEEIRALEKAYSKLKSRVLKVELQDLLNVVPRKRRRVDAYKGLCNVLRGELGCELVITSQKTKHDGK